MAITNTEEIVLSTTSSMTNQVIRLFWNLSNFGSFGTLAQVNARERELNSTELCPDRHHLLSNQASPSVVCSHALKSLFLMSRHLCSFA